jgi:excinuclease ABC subunit C
MATDLIEELLRQLPSSPGVYIMRNSKGAILYVGKSNNLKNRVRSYFAFPTKLSVKTQMLVEQIHDFEYFVVTSDQEALILELNLIKRYWPQYNVLLKDDKTFPYLKLKTSEDWPRLYITRRLEEDGSHYFGPFASIHSLRKTLDVLKRVFPLRSCTKPIVEGKSIRPCLKHDMGYCLAPCAGKVSRSEYTRVIKQLVNFLEGKQEVITRDIKKQMEAAAEAMKFESAAHFRDQLRALHNVIEGQRIAMKVRGEQDAIAFVTESDQAYVQVFMIRYGKLIGRETFTLKGTTSEELQQVMTSFVKQFYSASPYIPRLLLLQYPVEDQSVIEDWLSEKKGSRVEIEVPQKGNKKQLIDIVVENAKQGLGQIKIKQLAVPAALSGALSEIQKGLNLPVLPSRIECYDISNIQGTDAVGSMVVFEDGKPKTSDYRRFKIKTVEGANDYAMLQEMLKRRFKKAVSKEEKEAGGAWAIMPDLIVIDGGKGQLNAAREVLQETGMDSLCIAGLAKENEELFLPDRSEPVILPKSSLGLKLLQRLRDEAHRFAITYFQKVHKKRTFTSALDEIIGIGPKKKKALIKQFGTVQGIRQASLEEIQKVPGINKALAQKIKDGLGE